MFSLNHAAIFVWIFSRAFHDFLHSHIRSCLSQHHHCYLTALHHRLLRCCNPAVVIFSLHRRFRCCDFKALAYTAAQIVTSPLTLSGIIHFVRWPSSHCLSTSPPGDSLSRQSHSSIAITAIILTIDLAASSGRHTRQRHMPVDHQQHHPARYLRRLFSPDFTERRTSSLRASSPRRAPFHAAHAFIQLRIIVCSWAPFPAHRPLHVLLQSSSAATAGLSPRTILANDIETHGHFGHFVHISFMLHSFLHISSKHHLCIFI